MPPFVTGQRQRDIVCGQVKGAAQVRQAAAGVDLGVERVFPWLEVKGHDLEEAEGAGARAGGRIAARLERHDDGDDVDGQAVIGRPTLNVRRPGRYRFGEVQRRQRFSLGGGERFGGRR
jgi:hypothetical protein